MTPVTDFSRLPSGLGDAEVGQLHFPLALSSTFCGVTSRCTIPSGRPSRLRVCM